MEVLNLLGGSEQRDDLGAPTLEGELDLERHPELFPIMGPGEPGARAS
jgi:hypothetical protein